MDPNADPGGPKKIWILRIRIPIRNIAENNADPCGSGSATLGAAGTVPSRESSPSGEGGERCPGRVSRPRSRSSPRPPSGPPGLSAVRRPTTRNLHTSIRGVVFRKLFKNKWGKVVTFIAQKWQNHISLRISFRWPNVKKFLEVNMTIFGFCRHLGPYKKMFGWQHPTRRVMCQIHIFTSRWRLEHLRVKSSLPLFRMYSMWRI
jgi:hypothetical protein